MNPTIIVALISGGFSVLCAVLTLIGVFVSAKATRDKMSIEMDKKIAVIDTKMTSMQDDIKSHNNYAKMYADNMPAVKQHLTDIDRRLSKLEK